MLPCLLTEGYPVDFSAVNWIGPPPVSRATSRCPQRTPSHAPRSAGSRPDVGESIRRRANQEGGDCVAVPELSFIFIQTRRVASTWKKNGLLD